MKLCSNWLKHVVLCSDCLKHIELCCDWLKQGWAPGFFSVLNASFFCIFLKNATFFFEFLVTYETQKNNAFFCVLSLRT